MSAEPTNAPPGPPADDSLRTALLRMVKLAAGLLLLIALGIAAASYLGPESGGLPLQYDGFD